MDDDLGDLFGAFDGEETVEAVEAVAPQPKRKSDGVVVEETTVNGDAAGRAAKRAKRVDEGADGVVPEQEVKVQTVISGHKEMVLADGRKVISFSAVPADYVAPEAAPLDQPAKVYPFQLDPFQQAAIDFIEKGESVLVAAHTSAGKTVTAEYAIAMSLKKRQRVIYTSPIKALSNQKYRDMAEEFGDVGLMTGDITINPSATCLIMTTEILRSMLYRGSEIMREVAWVIYDEIHYMRDKDRGVVWEESIILLPHKVRFVFLSATIPNSQEFAGWISTIHHQPCHVVYTDYRPVPLQHYIFPSGGEGLYLVVDEKSKFREENFQKAMAVLQSEPDEIAAAVGEGKARKKDANKGQQSDLTKIVKLIMERGYDPVIIFSFSKRECEAYALKMAKLDLNEETEKDLIEQVFNNAIDSLSDEDKTLPQVVSLLPLLKRGIGIHHGGLLPILKEIVEILFQEGLIKCLFATETFSIGINMPAKTVVFTKCNKFDGKDFRWVTSGEYIQMSGRAGRRGKDDRGIVIMMLDSKMEPPVAKGILYGDPDKLYSSYHVSYNMLLNMLRVQGANPEFLVKSSFHQYQQEAAAPALEQEANDLEVEAKSIEVSDEEQLGEYYNLSVQLEGLKREMRKFSHHPDVIIGFAKRGRMVKIRDVNVDWGWGGLLNYKAMPIGQAQASSHILGSSGISPTQDAGYAYVFEVLLPVKKGTADGKPEPYDGKAAEYDVAILGTVLECVECMSAVVLHFPTDLRPPDVRMAQCKSLREVERRFKDQGGVPLLDPIKDMNIQEDAFKTLLDKAKALEKRYKDNHIHTLKDRDELFSAYSRKVELTEKMKLLRREARTHQVLVMKDDLKRMKRVLRRLGFVDSDNVLQLKGRVACEINTVDELVTTELIFNGVFNDLKPEQVVALLGCMCFEDKKKEGDSRVRSDMEAVFSKLKETARVVAKVQQECKIDVDPDEYAERFNPDLIEVLHAWTLGAKFSDVLKLTDAFEGTIIRAIRRLEEILRQLASASHAIGDHTLKDKFEECSKKIRRDIVFAASLYL